MIFYTSRTLMATNLEAQEKYTTSYFSYRPMERDIESMDTENSHLARAIHTFS